MQPDNRTAATAGYDLGKCAASGAVIVLSSILVAQDWILPSFVMIGLALIGMTALFFVEDKGAKYFSCILLAYLPFSKKLAGFPEFTDLTIILNLLLLIAAIIRFQWDREKNGEPVLSRFLIGKVELMIAAFLLLQFFSILLGFWYGGNYLWESVLVWLEGWVTPALVFILIRTSISDAPTLKTYVVIAMLAVGFAAVLGNHEYTALGNVSDFDARRIGGIVSEPNMFASYLNLYSYLFLGFLVVYWNRWRVWPLILPLMTAVRALIVTFSRGGYLAFAAGLYALTFFKNKILFVLILAVSAWLVFQPQYLPEAVRKRFSMTFEEKGGGTSLDRSSEDRIHVWRGAARLIQQHPVLGVGFNLFENKVTPYWAGTRRFNAHNAFLMVAAETGIPSLLLLLYILFLLFQKTYALYRHTDDLFLKATCLGLLSGSAGFLLNNFYIDSLSWQEISVHFWMIVAVILQFEEGRIAPAKEQA